MNQISKDDIAQSDLDQDQAFPDCARKMLENCSLEAKKLLKIAKNKQVAS